MYKKKTPYTVLETDSQGYERYYTEVLPPSQAIVPVLPKPSTGIIKHPTVAEARRERARKERAHYSILEKDVYQQRMADNKRLEQIIRARKARMAKYGPQMKAAMLRRKIARARPYNYFSQSPIREPDPVRYAL